MSVFTKLLASVAVAAGSATSGEQLVDLAWEAVKEASCPGEFPLKGLGNVSLVPTGWVPTDENVTFMRLEDGTINTVMRSRAYFASSCTAGQYDNKQYLAVDFRGKTLRYTTDLSQAGCGCNAALYLTSMRQNEKPSECGDFYCDANNVCGESCAEIDIQEANRHSWHSTLHGSWDHVGKGRGYGGGGLGWNGPREWSARDFGPHGRCVDTSKPFEVSVYFPVDGQGKLKAMEVTVGQHGHECVLWLRLDGYSAMAELDKAMAEGMTPIVSYWHSEDMLWLDGKGEDGQGPCWKDRPDQCGDTVRFSNFSVSPAFEPSTTSSTTPAAELEPSSARARSWGSAASEASGGAEELRGGAEEAERARAQPKGTNWAEVRAFAAGASAMLVAQAVAVFAVWAVSGYMKSRGQSVCPGESPMKREIKGSSQSLLMLAETGGAGLGADQPSRDLHTSHH